MLALINLICILLSESVISRPFAPLPSSTQTISGTLQRSAAELLSESDEKGEARFGAVAAPVKTADAARPKIGDPEQSRNLATDNFSNLARVTCRNSGSEQGTTVIKDISEIDSGRRWTRPLKMDSPASSLRQLVGHKMAAVHS